MSDIVERLRERAASGVNCLCGNPVCDEAAAEIEKLRAALKPFADKEYAYEGWADTARDAVWLDISNLRAAAAALKETNT